MVIFTVRILDAAVCWYLPCFEFEINIWYPVAFLVLSILRVTDFLALFVILNVGLAGRAAAVTSQLAIHVTIITTANITEKILLKYPGFIKSSFNLIKSIFQKHYVLLYHNTFHLQILHILLPLQNPPVVLSGFRHM